MQEQLRIGQYILERRIGQGGMAEVWTAHHVHLDHRVAVKFLHPEYNAQHELQERFLNEGKRQAKLQHPNIVPAVDFFQVDGRSFLVMPYVEGMNLEARLEERDRPLAFVEIHSISKQVLSALGHAHSLGIVHRDVKPSNILIDQSGRALLMDFGIAKALAEDRGVTLTNTFMGTPDYMSPEQVTRPKQVDARSDIYSFGCVLYAMLSGRPPFSEEGDTAFHIQERQVHNAPPPLVCCAQGVPAGVEQIMLKCLEKDPAQRFQSCGEVIKALDATTVSGSGKKPQPTFADTPTVIVKPPARQTVVEPIRKGTGLVPAPAPPPVQTSSGGLAKYFGIGGVAVILIAGLVYYLMTQRTHRLQALQQKDWTHVTYQDRDFSDCMNVQPCMDRKAQADQLLAVKDWKKSPYNNPLLQDCMGYAPCLERSNTAQKLLEVRDWNKVEDKQLLGDCMGYPACLKAEYKPPEAKAPASSSPAPAKLSCAEVAELYPCCNKAPDPAACLACKKREKLADCNGIF